MIDLIAYADLTWGETCSQCRKTTMDTVVRIEDSLEVENCPIFVCKECLPNFVKTLSQWIKE